MLDALRADISQKIGQKRFAHILSVEKEITVLGNRFLPEKVNMLRAAALLHDLTKEFSMSEQLDVCERYRIDLPSGIEDSPAVLHSYTAAKMIAELYSAFAYPEILIAVERHTVGHTEMSVFDKLLFIADYIEPTRKPASCKSVRAAFYLALKESRCAKDDFLALDFAVYGALKATISYLECEKLPILPFSYEVYNTFKARLLG